MDFKDINKASPKDNFLQRYMSASHSPLSFIDGYVGYNQVKMAEEVMKKTTFINPRRRYYYNAIRALKKNIEATY